MKKSNSQSSSSFFSNSKKISTAFSSETISSLFIFLLAISCVLFPELSFAGTGGQELQGVVDKTTELVEGNGARLAGLTVFIGSVIAAVVRNSIMPIIPGFGVAVLLGVGPSLFTSGVAAIIN